MSAAPCRDRGFNLLELVVTLAVAAMIVTASIPSMTDMITSVQLKLQVYDFNAALDTARSEAVMRGTYVTACPSTNQTACAAAGTNWESGWLVFVDKNNNHTVDAGEIVLRVSTALTAGYTLRATSGTTLPTYITFSAKGAPSASGAFVLCKNSAINPARAVLVGTSGRVTAAADHNGTPMNSSGQDMTTCTP